MSSTAGRRFTPTLQAASGANAKRRGCDGPGILLRGEAMENPTWGYRKGDNGEVEAKLFDGKLPKGWHDSPAKVKKG